MGLRHIRGKLGARREDAPGVIDRAGLMEVGLEQHTDVFLIPNPTLAIFSAQRSAAQSAQLLVSKGGKGVAAARNVEVGKLYGMMVTELAYFQQLADELSPDDAIALFHAGGVEVATFAQHNKALLSVTQEQPGAPVLLDANASTLLGDKRNRKHYFNWQSTMDGHTFVTLPSTPKAHTWVTTGLTPLTTVGFRVCVTTSDEVTSPWSQLVYLLIH